MYIKYKCINIILQNKKLYNIKPKYVNILSAFVEMLTQKKLKKYIVDKSRIEKLFY